MAMDFSGEYSIPARQQQVWDALNDPAVLQTCIAGCKQLDKVSDTEFAAIVGTRVGPISATFRGSVLLSELDAPNGYTLTGQGQGGAAGFAKMTARVSLAGNGDATTLKYVAEADIGGKLASVGSRLVQTVAKKNADDFFTAFARHFDGAGMPAEAVSAPLAPAAAPRASAAAATTAMASVPSSAPPSIYSAVPAWMAVFTCAIGFGFGYFVALAR
ncbi:carbon monoxide dehydrogenase subunit G [Herbaspirillum sp. ST 5-3]|uniref:SRPBCC family protein n=1 Tax=Oxalobacteraceae TaxID=75682 RepID=UPI0010A32AFB|nr:carbon monoxide dehydrogenase subunit G [Herbaspirillum sp. ST 5-3]